MQKNDANTGPYKLIWGQDYLLKQRVCKQEKREKLERDEKKNCGKQRK